MKDTERHNESMERLSISSSQQPKQLQPQSQPESLITFTHPNKSQPIITSSHSSSPQSSSPPSSLPPNSPSPSPSLSVSSSNADDTDAFGGYTVNVKHPNPNNVFTPDIDPNNQQTTPQRKFDVVVKTKAEFNEIMKNESTPRNEPTPPSLGINIAPPEPKQETIGSLMEKWRQLTEEHQRLIVAEKEARFAIDCIMATIDTQVRKAKKRKHSCQDSYTYSCNGSEFQMIASYDAHKMLIHVINDITPPVAQDLASVEVDNNIDF